MTSPDFGVRKEDAFSHILCMDVQPNLFRYAIINKNSKSIAFQEAIPIEDYERSTFDEILKRDQFKLDYAEFVLSTGHERNTLVPVDIFNHSKPEDIFRLNYSEPIETIDYNRIPEMGIVNIYEFPLWLKKAFIVRFPRVKVVHQTTVMLKAIFSAPVFTPKMHVLIEPNYFFLFVTGRSKLQFFNKFEYKAFSDIIYHILFVAEQKELDPAEIIVNVFGVDKNWAHAEEIQSYFKQPIKLGTKPEDSTSYILSKQLLCV